MPAKEAYGYSLFLTKGVNYVSQQGAAAIVAAIEGEQKTVEVDLLLFPGSSEAMRARIVTAHVIALSEVERPQREVIANEPKVTALWDRRFPRAGGE